MTQLETRSKPSLGAAILITTRLFLGQLVTRMRLLVLGALGLVVALLGLLAPTADDPIEVGAGIIMGVGLAIVVPIATLVLASATIGEMRTEGTLVYLWLRPTPHWATSVAAVAATLIVALPLSVVPIGVSAVLSRESSIIVPAMGAATIAACAYTGLFVTLGALANRAFLIGLGYILIWEASIARLGGGFAKLSVLSYAASVMEHSLDVDLGGGQSLALSVIVTVGVLVGGVLATARILARREIL